MTNFTAGVLANRVLLANPLRRGLIWMAYSGATLQIRPAADVVVNGGINIIASQVPVFMTDPVLLPLIVAEWWTIGPPGTTGQVFETLLVEDTGGD